MARITEAEIADVIVEILGDQPGGEATIAQLITEIPHRIRLSAEDLAPSLTRNGEAIWEQQVRNITSHRKSPGNAIHDGKLISVRSGFRLPRRAA